MSIRVRVKPTFTCYHNHRRYREGEIFEIKNMGAFSKNSMELVDKDTKPVVKEEGPREPAALSQGSKALNTGKVKDPAKASKEAEAVAKESDAGAGGEAGAGDQNPPAEGETTGNEDVI